MRKPANADEHNWKEFKKFIMKYWWKKDANYRNLPIDNFLEKELWICWKEAIDSDRL